MQRWMALWVRRLLHSTWLTAYRFLGHTRGSVLFAFIGVHWLVLPAPRRRNVGSSCGLADEALARLAASSPKRSRTEYPGLSGLAKVFFPLRTSASSVVKPSLPSSVYSTCWLVLRPHRRSGRGKTLGSLASQIKVFPPSVNLCVLCGKNLFFSSSPALGPRPP